MLPDHRTEIDPALADAVRDAVTHPVDPATARRHLSAIVATAQAGAQPATRRSRARRRRWRTGIAAGAAALLLPVGLSFAGVPLPAVVEEPYRAIGLDLPGSSTTPPAPATVPDPITIPTPTAAPNAGSKRPPAGDRRADRRQVHRDQRRADRNEADGRRRASRRSGGDRAANGGAARRKADGGRAISGRPPGLAEGRSPRAGERRGSTRPGGGAPAPGSAPGPSGAQRGERRGTDPAPVKQKSHEGGDAPVAPAPAEEPDAARQRRSAPAVHGG